MIVSTLLLLVAAPADCSEKSGARISSECALEQSLRQLPDLDCEEPMTQTAMNVCSYRKYLRADITLNQTWSQVAERYRDENGQTDTWNAILKAQRSWLAYRDAECAVQRDRFEGGSIAPLIANSCLFTLTEQRTEQLQTLLDEN